MSDTILNFETTGRRHIATIETSDEVPRVGENVHFETEYKVTDVLYDYGAVTNGEREHPEIWITAIPIWKDDSYE